MSNGNGNEAVVLTLRKRYSSQQDRSNGPYGSPVRRRNGDYTDQDVSLEGSHSVRLGVSETNHRGLNHRLSFDDASGVIALPEDSRWLMEDVDSLSDDDGVNPSSRSQLESGDMSSNTLSVTVPQQRYGTYYHHPEKRIPGAFPRL